MRRKRTSAASCAVFQRLPVAATVTDARGRVLSVNREAGRLAGGKPAPGQSCRDYWGCRIARARCPLVRALASGHPVYHAFVHTSGPRGKRTMVERVSLVRSGGRRQAIIVTGPATAFVERLRRLRREAGMDFLTAIPNRRRFDQLSARAFHGERRGRTSAFIMMDIDRFKRINDRFGHAGGDRALRRLGLLLRRATRRSDVVGRVGGDEFAVYCPNTSRARAAGLVRRLRRAIAQDNAAHPGEARLSVQFGVACAPSRRIADLRAKADARLYLQKKRRLGPAAG